MFKSFEEIIAWQKAKAFTVKVYAQFGTLNDFEFRSQIRRAAISICNNIAEGYDRRSDAEFRNFLYFAISSNSEVRSMLYLAEELNYCTTDQANSLRQESEEVARIIRGLIRSLVVKD
jgi:four helix bundle protein